MRRDQKGANQNDKASDRYVRITGVKADRFVEFEFSIGDPELSIDMIMPFTAFQEFCATQAAQKLSAAQEAKVDYERLKWRFGRPGITE